MDRFLPMVYGHTTFPITVKTAMSTDYHDCHYVLSQAWGMAHAGVMVKDTYNVKYSWIWISLPTGQWCN